MTTYPLASDGVFWTLQGEGALQGTPMVFVRLAGCSVGCVECDTDYRLHRRVEISALVREIQGSVPAGFQAPWVWLTGGEPTDHDIAPLIDVLRTINMKVALATAGTRKTPLVDWISVSPHTAEAVQRFGHELKVIPGLNGLSWEAIGTIDREWHSFPYRFVQPLWGSDPGPCVDFVKSHPGWRLTAQAHKGWRIP